MDKDHCRSCLCYCCEKLCKNCNFCPDTYVSIVTGCYIKEEKEN